MRDKLSAAEKHRLNPFKIALLRVYKKYVIYLPSQLVFLRQLKKRDRWQVIEGPFKGWNKTVYKVKVNNKKIAISLAISPFVSKKADVQEYFKKLISARRLHETYFQEFTVKERTFPTKDPRKKIFISEWVDEPEELKDIFENIVANEKRIIELANKYPEFKKELIKFAKHILYVYQNYGLMIDVFNFVTKGPSNIKVDKDKKIKIIDLHLLYVKHEKYKKPGCNLVGSNLEQHFNKVINVLERLVQL